MSGTSTAAAPRIRNQAACCGVKPAPIKALANGPDPPNVIAEKTANPNPTDFVLYMGITLSRPLHACRVGSHRTFTARAAMMATVSSEIADWTPISILVRAVSGIVSVGLNAVAAVNETNR